MDPGTESEVVESLVGCRSRLVLFELCCLDDHTFRPFSAPLSHVQNEVKTIRIAPIRAEHRHEPSAARLVDFFYIVTRGHLSQTLPRPDLFDAKFGWRGQKHFQHMPDAGQKLMT